MLGHQSKVAAFLLESNDPTLLAPYNRAASPRCNSESEHSKTMHRDLVSRYSQSGGLRLSQVALVFNVWGIQSRHQ